VDQTKNYYSTSIISPRYRKENEDDEEYKFKSIDLSSVYVPVISKINNQNKFQFRHITQINNNETLTIEQQHSLPLSEYVSLINIVEENSIIHNIMDYLGILLEATD
jgi:hypothetical protein